MADIYSHKDLCPLGDPSSELRILEIIDNGHEPIECKLVKREKDDKYSTLSWCWGGQEQSPNHEIRIIQSSQSYAFHVPQNLESAIRALRYHGELKVWIDYICMDQKDMNEKNYQVPMMASIYGDAKCVYVWLGEESDDSKLAMDFIQNRVLNLRDFDRLIGDDKTVKEWQALSALMKRPWFSRRWIVQEIAVAQRATLLCGEEKMEWKEFADAISLFNEVETRTRGVSEIMKNNKELGHMPDFFGDVSELSATKLVEETNNLFRRLSGNERQAQFTLEYLVSKLTTFESSQPRDTIYALLAIARDTVPITTRIGADSIRSLTWPEYIKEKFVRQLAKKNVSKPYHVDYRLPLSDVYVQFVKWAIEKSDKTCALDIICRPWAPIPKAPGEFNNVNDGPKDNSDDDYDDEERNTHWRIKTWSKRPSEDETDTLPSWIPTVARAPFGMVSTGEKMTRKNADSLVGLPPRRVYSAAGTRTITESFRVEDGVTKYSRDERQNGLHYHSIFVEGFILDEVGELKHPSQQGNIPSDWIKMAGRNYQSGELPDEFWRTLVVDRSPTGENAQRYYPRLVHHALKQGVQGDALNTKDVVNWGRCGIVGEVLRRVQSSIWNRTMMRTKTDRRFGLAPQYTKQGDLICILYGCSVPVLLRKFSKSKEEVEEEDRQRLKKQQEELERRRNDAALKIVQLWRAFLATRKAKSSHQNHTPSRKRKTGPTNTTPSSKRRRSTRTFNGTASGTQSNGSASVPTDRGSPRVTQEPAGIETSRPAVGVDAKKEKPLLKSDPYTYYQLIGECYVDGMMNGEALYRFEGSTLFEIR
ncbi:HET-domain-containing protein [Hypomontagnella monticulosa]|nr:HET-domain-containing protein [Hypomontagnella monticulosa]